MARKFSFIGPAVFMDGRGKLYKQAADNQYIPIENKYTAAEDRFVKRNLQKKGWADSCQKAF